MRKTLYILALLCSFSVQATDWEIAHPFADTKQIPKFNERYFREAYVQYRLDDNGNTLVIDLHDQFLRAGSFSDYAKRCKAEMIGDEVTVNKKMLTRIFALFSEIKTKKKEVGTQNYSPIYQYKLSWFEKAKLKLDYGPWWMVDNFGWLDDTLEKVDIADIVVAVSSRFRGVSTIKFSLGNENRPYQLSEVAFDPHIESWVDLFGKQGITLEY